MVSLLSGGLEVAVVYFRNGYMPQNYVSEQVLPLNLYLKFSIFNLKTYNALISV